MNRTFEDTLNQIASDPRVSPAKLYIFSKMNQENLEIFKAIWPTIPVKRRRAIIQELLEISEVNFEVDFDPVFLTALGDEDAEVRAGAVKSLWEYEKASLIAPLIHLLKADEAAIVREAAASALGKFIYLRELEEINWHEANLAEEALLQVIYQGNETIDVRRRAVESIAYSSNPGITEIIESAYYHDDEKMQVSAIFAMGRNADAHWIPRVVAELENPSAEIRFEAARASGELEAKEAIDKLVAIIEEDPDQETQEMAIWALGRIGGPTARQILEACLEGDNEALVLAAEEALDEINMFEDSLMLYDFEVEEFEDDDFEDYLDIDYPNGHSRNSDYLN
jgi:HEAT repeat protein